MSEELENKLDEVKLKYSDMDVSNIINDTLKDTNYDFLKKSLIEAFKNYHISKLEREYGAV